MQSTGARSLAGRIALLTGANTGIGLVTARELAKQGAHLFITCRSAERAQRAPEQMRAASRNAVTRLLCATAPEIAQDSGLYYDKSRPRTPRAMARDKVLAAELWQRSVQRVLR